MNDLPPAPTLVGLQPSFGFGDRLGLATPGHVDAARHAGRGITPIFAQQSIREMARTRRQPADVMHDAMSALAATAWTEPHGADADHLKTTKDINRTAAAGFTFFTLDPSDYVDQQADDYDESTLRQRADALRAEIDWLAAFPDGKSIRLLGGTTIHFTNENVMRAQVKYGRAIGHALKLASHIRKVQSAAGSDWEIEISIDETPQPTSLAEHWILADRFLAGGGELVSLAPRLPGDFEKGVDFIGNLANLEGSLHAHATIASTLGPYKLSLHSGSDKLAVYPQLARATKGQFHVKTAGTSYLEALRVAAHCEPELFRDICRFARQRYEADRATYHVHARLDTVPPPDELPGRRALEQTYLERWEEVPVGQGFQQCGRQILHCTFGSVLTDSRFGPALHQCLEMHADTYRQLLATHFARHLSALQAGG